MGMYAFSPTSTMPLDHKKEAYECAAALDYIRKEENDEKKMLSHLKKRNLINGLVSMRTELMGHLVIASYYLTNERRFYNT